MACREFQYLPQRGCGALEEGLDAAAATYIVRSWVRQKTLEGLSRRAADFRVVYETLKLKRLRLHTE
jgi:hypothetical protein